VAGDPWPPAVLLIGDKVVTNAPPSFDYMTTLDLGDLWWRHTGLPFVFATWMARPDGDRDAILRAGRILDRQLRHNRERVDGIVHRRAAERGWPEAAARTYLSRRLLFDFTDRTRAGMELFFEKAAAVGAVDAVRPLETWPVGAAVPGFGP
jgi:chorismate dehydratase